MAESRHSAAGREEGTDEKENHAAAFLRERFGECSRLPRRKESGAGGGQGRCSESPSSHQRQVEGRERKDSLLWRTASFWKEGFFRCGGRDCLTGQASKPLCSPCGYRNAQCAGAS